MKLNVQWLAFQFNSGRFVHFLVQPRSDGSYKVIERLYKNNDVRYPEYYGITPSKILDESKIQVERFVESRAIETLDLLGLR